MENWKRIPGYSLYEASDLGKIKTFNWKNKKTEAIMKPSIDGSGYLRTMLKRDSDGEIHTIKVHRIIGITFIPNPNNKPQINHKNGIRTDNRVINLEWVNNSENIKDSFAKGRSSNLGSKNPCATLTEEQVMEIRKNYVYGRKTAKKGDITKRQIAEKYGTSFNVIKLLIQKRSWKHLL
jgi:hypothetical protein